MVRHKVKKELPLISVIITNYNYGRYITKAISSVLNQTYKNIELVIINDGSLDDSDTIIKNAISKYKGKNIRYISRKNKGIVYTRNEGIEVSKGEYISYLDADDYFNKDYISKSYKIAKEYDADVVYPNWHFVGEWLGRPDTDFPEFKPELLQLQKLHCTPASLIRKDSIKNRRFEVEKVAEDWDFFIGLSLDGAKFKLAKNNFINYRIRTGTRGSQNHPEDDTQCFVEILTKYKNEYGDKVIDPAKLVSLRHPNLIIRMLSMKLPCRVIDSVRKNGIRGFTRKVLARIFSRNKMLWRFIQVVRNINYNKQATKINSEKSNNTKLAVVLHLYYPELWEFIRERLQSINVPFDLYVSVTPNNKDIKINKINNYHKATNIIALPNRGRDVLPFIIITREISKYNQYEYVLKLHSKKSLHRSDGNQWLDSLMSELIPADVSEIIEVLNLDSTGAIGPSSHVVSLSRYIGDNLQRMSWLLDNIAPPDLKKKVFENSSRYPFFGGTMFWCRIDLLYPLLNSKLTPADFNTENGQIDGTTAHAIERILGKTIHEISRKNMYVINKKGKLSQLSDKSYKSKYKHV